MAMLGYMKVKIAGTEAEGGCTQKDVGPVKREKACEVYAFDHTVELPVNVDTGLPTGSRVHRPMKVTVYLDQAAPLLEDALCHGKEVEGDIWFVRNAQTPEGLEGYYHINFKTARVVSLPDDPPGPGRGKQADSGPYRNRHNLFRNYLGTSGRQQERRGQLERLTGVKHDTNERGRRLINHSGFKAASGWHNKGVS